MPFTTAYIARSPDADPARHRGVVETGLSTLHTVIVRDQEQALAVARELVEEHGVCTLTLCPGHSNQEVGEIAAAAGAGVSVSVARGDPAGGPVVARAMEEAGWPKA